MSAGTLSVVFGTVLGTIGVASALAQDGGAHAVVYRLGRPSTYQEGCFPPCECPLMEELVLRGTFKVTPTGFDGLYWTFEVTDVRWKVLVQDAIWRRITGSGTYRVGGEFAITHQLELDLRVGDDPVRHFDSGLIPGGFEFPRIDIFVSMNGMYCYDTVLHVVARRAGDIDRNGHVDLQDLASFASCFAVSAPDSVCGPDAFWESDIDETGEITLSDFAIFVLNFQV